MLKERRLNMQELLDGLQELIETAHTVYKDAQLTEDESGLAHAEGVLDGLNMVLTLIKDIVKVR